MKMRIPRRKLLRDLTRAGTGMGALAILGLAPELAAAQRDPTTFGGRSRLDTEDPIIRHLWTQARKTREWSRFGAAMTTGVPASYVAAAGAETQLLTFTVRDLDPRAVEARRYSSFELLRDLAFVFGADGTVADVAHFIPNEESGSLQVEMLRSRQSEIKALSAGARAFIASRRAEAEAIRARTPRSARTPSTLKLARPLGTHCDCYPERVYCGQTQCYDGHFDSNCLILCGFCRGNALCYALCVAACWVPGYCICVSTYCGPCLEA